MTACSTSAWSAAWIRSSCFACFRPSISAAICASAKWNTFEPIVYASKPNIHSRSTPTGNTSAALRSSSAWRGRRFASWFPDRFLENLLETRVADFFLGYVGRVFHRNLLNLASFPNEHHDVILAREISIDYSLGIGGAGALLLTQLLV